MTGFGSVVKHLPTQELRVCSPLTPTKMTKKEICFSGSSQEIFSVYHVKEPSLSCVVGSPILHYGPLIKTNNLYAPTPNENVRVWKGKAAKIILIKKVCKC